MYNKKKRKTSLYVKISLNKYYLSHETCEEYQLRASEKEVEGFIQWSLNLFMLCDEANQGLFFVQLSMLWSTIYNNILHPTISFIKQPLHVLMIKITIEYQNNELIISNNQLITYISRYDFLINNHKDYHNYAVCAQTICKLYPWIFVLCTT